jgi:hypothetical protein
MWCDTVQFGVKIQEHQKKKYHGIMNRTAEGVFENYSGLTCECYVKRVM